MSWAQSTALLDIAVITYKATCFAFSFLWQNNLCSVSGPAPSIQVHVCFNPVEQLSQPCPLFPGNCRSVPVGVRQQELWHAQESGTVPASLLAGEEQRCWTQLVLQRGMEYPVGLFLAGSLQSGQLALAARADRALQEKPLR